MTGERSPGRRIPRCSDMHRLQSTLRGHCIGCAWCNPALCMCRQRSHPCSRTFRWTCCTFHGRRTWGRGGTDHGTSNLLRAMFPRKCSFLCRNRNDPAQGWNNCECTAFPNSHRAPILHRTARTCPKLHRTHRGQSTTTMGRHRQGKLVPDGQCEPSTHQNASCFQHH